MKIPENGFQWIQTMFPNQEPWNWVAIQSLDLDLSLDQKSQSLSGEIFLAFLYASIHERKILWNVETNWISNVAKNSLLTKLLRDRSIQNDLKKSEWIRTEGRHRIF